MTDESKHTHSARATRAQEGLNRMRQTNCLRNKILWSIRTKQKSWGMGQKKGVGQSQGNWYGRHKRQKDRHGRHKSHLILAWVWQNHKTPTLSIQRPKSILYLQALLLPPNKQTLWWTVLLTSGIARTIPFELIYFCRKKGMRGKWENDRDGGG